MSSVTDTILVYPLCDNDSHVLRCINTHLPARGGCDRLVHVNEAPRDRDTPPWYGGSKVLQANVAVGAFNYFDLEGFIANLQEHEAALREVGCDFIQLLVQGEHDHGFTLIDVLHPTWS